MRGSCTLSRHSKRNQGCKITNKTTTVYQAGRDKLRNNLINTKKKYFWYKGKFVKRTFLATLVIHFW